MSTKTKFYEYLFNYFMFYFFYTILFIGIDKKIHKMNWQEIFYARGVILFFIISYEIFSPIIIEEFKESFFLHYEEALFFTKIVYATWISLVAYSFHSLFFVEKITNLSLKVLLSSAVLIIGDWYFSP